MELIQSLELNSLLTVGTTIVASALERQESRGAHFRTDYPQRDDQNYLHHSLVYCQEGKLNIAKRSVDLSLQAIDRERFTPQERKY